MKPNNTPWRPWIRLVPFDLAGAVVAFWAAYWIRISSGIIPYYAEASLVQYMTLYFCSLPILIVVFQIIGLYDRHSLFEGTLEYAQVLKGCTFFIFGVVLVSFAGHDTPPSRGWLVTTWVSIIILINLNRFIFRKTMQKIWKAGNAPERAVILGASEESKAIAQRLEQSGIIDVVGFLDDFGPPGEEILNGRRILGTPSSYRDIAKKIGASLAILVPDANSWETKREVLSRAAMAKDIELQIAPGLSDLPLVSMRVGFRGTVPLLRFGPGYSTGLDAVSKCLLDYLLAVTLLVVTAPIMAVVAFRLFLQKKRRIIERFEVLGKNGSHFQTFKFRTGEASATSYRSFRTKVPLPGDQDPGNNLEQLLFRTGLDKLPQLFNVLMGQMSIVGPRTIPPELSKRYGQWLYSLVAVRPGITGSWAMHETGDLEREISLTLHYVRNWSIWADLAIIGYTVIETFRTRFRTRLKTAP